MIFNRKVVALVPMKEHSERVPGKNMRPFAGRPLFHHILDTLENTYAVDKIVVDTDSERIAAEASAHFPKVRVLDRPEELRGDFVSMNKVIAYDISQVLADVYLQTHATNPLLRSGTIVEALRGPLVHLHDLLGQCRLANLPGSQNGNDGEVAQQPKDGLLVSLPRNHGARQYT